MNNRYRKQIRIVSDGIGYNTAIYNPDGTLMEYVRSIRIDIGLKNYVTAQLEIIRPQIDVKARITKIVKVFSSSIRNKDIKPKTYRYQIVG